MFITVVLFAWYCPSHLKPQYTKWKKNMDNKSYDLFCIMQATIYANMQYYAEKIKKQDSNLNKLTTMVEKMMDNIQI